ncbi:cold-shock protein [Hoeflea poritis]|uniref:Cold-shock protein n=1 Tax=Hoeflea poritis TaxID=2993659 RepID=A0ABT4VVX9_9HYPH|nr:cold-shock protein [Hoeflea poritis]MDA4848861.1 cold-shock protein [Hoeflea poritis]
MTRGTVKFFNSKRGFGFITPDEGTEDILVHIASLEASGIGGLADGQKIQFDTVPDRNGRNAASNLQLT